MKVIILNDTQKALEGDKPHFGCELVMETFSEQLDRVGIEVLETISGEDKDPQGLERADLVIVNGEGSIHHDNRNELIDVAERYPCVLMNAVFQENSHRPGLDLFKAISVRESNSARSLQELGVEATVVPDVIYSSQRLKRFAETNPGPLVHRMRRTLLPGRRRIGRTDNVLNERSGFSARVDADTYMRVVKGYDAICTGRFHTAVLSACLGVPFAAWPSNTHKLEGMLNDMGIPELMATTEEDAFERIPDAVPPEVPKFVAEARRKIDAQFEQLHDLV